MRATLEVAGDWDAAAAGAATMEADLARVAFASAPSAAKKWRISRVLNAQQ